MTGSLFEFLSRWFVRWYVGRVAGRYCCCEWPIKSKRLMHLCGRIDDAYDRESDYGPINIWPDTFLAILEKLDRG